MSWDFKNNPFLRTILVVFIGLIAFGLLFDSFTGGTETMGGGGHMGGEHMGNAGMGGGYGYSIGGLISGLLVLLIKILMIVLVIAVIAGIFFWIRNTFFQNTNSKFIQSIKNDPILKTISVVTLAIIGILLVFALLGSFNQPGMGYSGHMGNYGFGFGYSPVLGIAGLLTLLVKVLMFVLIVSLILAVVAYLKNQYDQGNLNLFGTNKNQGMNPNQGVNPSGTGNIYNPNNQPPNDNTGNG